ncbi:MAG: flippase-like domain-containing protein [Candidatus Eisenbacteria bacterium]|nr:flippase-like domain-containing protein [Candidatus Eisenbacteria bacterium]
MIRRLLLGLAITGLLLWWVLRGIDWGRVGDALGRAHYAWLVPAMAFTMLGYLVRSYRWKFLLAGVKDIRTASLFSATLIGFLANVILPARLGELVRPYVIGRREGVSKTASLATIVVERIFDLTTLLACFGGVMLVYPHGFSPWLRRAGLTVLVINVVVLGVLVLLQVQTQRFLALARRLMRPLPAGLVERIAGLLASFAEGLGVLRNGHHLLRISLLSVLMWFTIVLSIWSTLESLHLGLPLYASAVLMVVISVGIMLPSAPGYFGPMQVACQAGLAIFGVDASTAFTYSFLYMVTQHLPVLGFGFFYMWKENLTLGDISRVGSREAERPR